MSAPVATVASPQQPSSDTSAAAFTETTVTFEGPEGFPLVGILCEPTPQSAAAAAAGVHSSSGSSSSRRLFSPNQCAILCHGFASHKNGFHFPAIAHHMATELGMSSLRFDYTGNMDSPGPFRFASFMQEVEQMALAKQYLEQQHGKQVILLLGHSRGAINATLYSGRDSISMPPSQQQQQQPHPEPPSQQQQQQQQSLATPWSHIIPIVVLVAGRYDLTLNMHQRYGSDVLQQLRQSGPSPQRTRRDKDGHEIHWELDEKGMAERFSTDIAGACERISALPEAVRPKVLVMHGVTDPICEASDATNLAQHIKGSTLLEVEGADHWYKGKRQQLLDAVTEFVQQAGREKGLC